MKTVLVIVALLYLGSLAGFYYAGKRAERRAYTQAYSAQVEAAFWDGYATAKKQQLMVPANAR